MTHITKADPPLTLSEPAGRDLAARWKELCTHLLATISPEKLGLTFVCDVKDLESANQIIEPLMTLPPLRECTIQLRR